MYFEKSWPCCTVQSRVGITLAAMGYTGFPVICQLRNSHGKTGREAMIPKRARTRNVSGQLHFNIRSSTKMAQAQATPIDSAVNLNDPVKPAHNAKQVSSAGSCFSRHASQMSTLTIAIQHAGKSANASPKIWGRFTTGVAIIR